MLARTATLTRKPTVVGSSTRMAGGTRWIPLAPRPTPKRRHKVLVRTGKELRPRKLPPLRPRHNEIVLPRTQARYRKLESKEVRPPSRVSCKAWIVTRRPGNKVPSARRIISGKVAAAKDGQAVRERAPEETKMRLISPVSPRNDVRQTQYRQAVFLFCNADTSQLLMSIG
jgi:hypothetical protein